MTSVAVIAHAGKSIGGGLGELRSVLERAGVSQPIWYEVPKSRYAPKRVRRALDEGADLVFVWGGDGMVQRCLDALVGSEATVAIVPAGTANLLASNLGIARDIEAAVHTGLHGASRTIDVGAVNGEHFGVMAGTGFDAMMIAGVRGAMKHRLGRAAYFVSGARSMRVAKFRARIAVDGDEWFDGRASCVLVGNVGHILGGIAAFPDAVPDDGLLDVGIVTAEGLWQWGRALARTLAGEPARSPFVQTLRARRLDIRLGKALPYELDGGARPPKKRLRVEVRPAAITIRVPEETMR
jgi:diacylglycerol kinase (ATP)